MRRLVARLLLGCAALLALLAVYGVAIEPRLLLDRERVTAVVPGLPSRWSGAEIAVFSDLQIGMWLANEGMIERVVDDVVRARPDAVLLGGDFVYSAVPDVPVQVDRVVELLAPLEAAGIPAYAVLGNHDHAVGAIDELTQALEAAGIEVLVNDAATIAGPRGADGQDLYVVGLGPTRPGLAEPRQALSQVPDGAPRLVLLHNPTSFPELPAGAAPMAVAGHTHCGQVALPGTPRWSYLALTEEEALVAEGWAPSWYGAAGNRLFVTCGVGFSLLPVRINAPPQVVYLELAAPGSPADR